jgi:cytochrome c oxidase subunit 3
MSELGINRRLANRMHPHKFAMWISMASILMMFGAFTSAYIVRQAAGNWLEFPLPNIFFISTIVILVSSVTIHASYKGFTTGKESQYKSMLIASFVLGIAFVVLQYFGWQELFSIGIDFNGNPSGSFLYVITGVHAAHVLGGIAALTVAMMHAFSLKFKPTEKRNIRFQLVVHYWHFLDFLWIYLLVFLIFTR